ncbi:store-operated calcium entry-associated regulatory factor-like [Tubulanus polymorphus]|uniref:store-operated calcium entry-associated regulatory factor-like n=1 Tax=Tubulanus polymorphus TaxID=672921 RepID=UPI003DA4FF9A
MISKSKLALKIMDYLPLVLLTIAAEMNILVSADRKMRLSDIQVLTLYNGKMTNARRSSPIPQVKCIGGTAGCNSFTPNVVQCYNRGSDGYDVQWECKTDMDNSYRFGRVEVSCEGYEYRDDPYILRGSCGLEYTIDLTEAGYKKRAHGGSSYYGNKEYGSSYGGYYKQLTKGTSVIGDLIMLVIVGLIIYAIYKTCIGNQHDYRYDGSSMDSDDTYSSYDSGFGPSAPPPPPGFRPEYMPRGSSYPGGCRTNYGTTTRNDNDTGFGGFWTGAALGGLAGYFFGNSGTTTTHGTTRRRGWTSGSSWSSDSFSDSAFGGNSSESSRTASGFGGTQRR